MDGILLEEEDNDDWSDSTFNRNELPNSWTRRSASCSRWYRWLRMSSALKTIIVHRKIIESTPETPRLSRQCSTYICVPLELHTRSATWPGVYYCWGQPRLAATNHRYSNCEIRRNRDDVIPENEGREALPTLFPNGRCARSTRYVRKSVTPLTCWHRRPTIRV